MSEAALDTTRPSEPSDLAALRKAIKVVTRTQSLGTLDDTKSPGNCRRCGFDIWAHDYDEGESCPPYKKAQWEIYQSLVGPTVVLSLLDRIEELCCADCAVESTESGGPACTGCRIGSLARYLRGVLAERFHLDYVTGRWAGLCGHVWTEEQREELGLNKETCPWCFMKLKIETYERMLEGAGLIEA